MKIGARTIFVSIGCTLIGMYLLWSMIWFPKKCDEKQCPAIQYKLQDSLQRRYVDSTELSDVLLSHNIYPVGKPLSSICCQEIEDILTAHPMLHTVECYMSADGVVHVPIIQRIPLLRIETRDTCYLVDCDRRTMPIRPTILDTLLEARGAINDSIATGPLATLTEWLNQNEYWKQRIDYVTVDTLQNIRLMEADTQTAILIGTVEDIDNKMDNLRKLYENGFDQMGWKHYEELDLRFEGQVVGRNERKTESAD